MFKVPSASLSLALKTTFFRSNRLKPGISTLIVYVPGATWPNTKRPVSSVVVVRTNFLSASVALTVAPGTTAPPASATDPEMVPLVVWPLTTTAHVNRTDRITHIQFVVFISHSSQWWLFLLKQLCCEFVEIVTPIDPCVRAWTFLEHGVEPMFLEQIHRRFARRDQPVIFSRAEPHQLQSLLKSCVVQHRLVPGFPTRTSLCRRCCRIAGKFADKPRTVHADIGETVEMRNGDVECLASAHRQTGHGGVSAFGQHTIVLLDVWHDVVDEVFREIILGGKESR